MTDETPDPTPAPTPDEGPEFVVTPTLRAFREIVERIEHLESHAPAIDEDDAADEQAGGADLTLVHERLTRHRGEIEAIKRAVNGLIRFVQGEAPIPAEIPAATVAAPPAPTPAPADEWSA